MYIPQQWKYFFIACISMGVIIIGDRFFVTTPSIYVIDGDTFSYGSSRVRLIGADTPELSSLEPFSLEAKEFTQQSLTMPFRLESLSSRNTDVYDRLLRSVVLHTNERLESLLIEKGLARVYYDSSIPYAILQDFCAKEQKAQEQFLGIWNEENRYYFMKKTPRCP